jgi:hypothetical protein
LAVRRLWPSHREEIRCVVVAFHLPVVGPK